MPNSLQGSAYTAVQYAVGRQRVFWTGECVNRKRPLGRKTRFPYRYAGIEQDKDCALAETENLFWLFVEERCNALLRIAGFSIWGGSSRHRARRVVVQFKPREIIHKASRSTHGSTKRS